MGGGAGQGGVVVLDHADFEVGHKACKAPFIAEGVAEPELGEVGGEGAGDAADQIYAAKWQLDQGQVAAHGAEDAGEEFGGLNGAWVGAIGAGGHDVLGGGLNGAVRFNT